MNHITKCVEVRKLVREAKLKWPTMNVYAAEYARPILVGDSDACSEDGLKTQVLYFLSNCTGWRGEDAKRIKTSLKQIVGIK